MITCRICGFEQAPEEIEAKEMMYGTGDTFTYFRCKKCDCLQIKEIPENLGKYYADQYYSFDIRDGSKKNSNNKNNPKKVLDVGCGSGEFLCDLALEGEYDLFGCDPFIESDIEYENGVRIFKKTIHEMDGKFDLIFMNDSFEHVTDPHEVMDSAYRLLSDDGILRIKIPVFPNIAFEMFRANWYQLDAPRHIFLHSENSMSLLAKNHGFEIISSVWDSNNSQIVRSFLYSKGVPFVKQTPEVISEYFTQNDLVLMEENSKLANLSKTGDHAMFTLKKAK